MDPGLGRGEKGWIRRDAGRKRTGQPKCLGERYLLRESIPLPSLDLVSTITSPLNLGIWNFAVAELFDSILFTKGKGRKGGKRISKCNLLRTRFVKRVNLAFIFNSCDNNLWAVVFQRLHEINWSSFNPFSVYIFPKGGLKKARLMIVLQQSLDIEIETWAGRIHTIHQNTVRIIVGRVKVPSLVHSEIPGAVTSV